MGVERIHSNARSMSMFDLFAFCIVSLTVCMVRSMNPLLCGYLGLEVTC
jgi:hypothetical protein